MEILTPGHKYELASFEGGTPQILQFIEKRPRQERRIPFVGEALPVELETVNDGTTNEELLEVLIDRLIFLGARLPSRENSIAVTKLQEALMWLNKRTADRKARAVEGSHRA